jgi:hypothetical protein
MTNVVLLQNLQTVHKCTLQSSLHFHHEGTYLKNWIWSYLMSKKESRLEPFLTLEKSLSVTLLHHTTVTPN